jgi:sigma-E factor negative regulatory protein RseA
MDERLQRDELLSALADGELRDDELARALQVAAADRQALATWESYHLIGDVLRSRELAACSPAPVFLERLSARLAQEPGFAPQDLPQPASAVLQVRAEAANDGSFRWKLVAGFASLAAVAAVGWSVLGAGGAAPAGPQLAQGAAPAAQSQPQAGVPAQALVARGEPGQVMLRDPRLDELLAAHRQHGAASALQMPAGFLRNATFEHPDR